MARPKGTPQSVEWRRAQSECMKKRWADKKNREAQSKKLKESWSDPELRKRQSEMVKKKAQKNPEKWQKSDEHRAKISKALTDKPQQHTKEQHKKIAEANRGQKRSVKTCECISEAKKGQTYRPRSEEHTRNQAKTQTGIPKNHGTNVSKAMKEYFDSPAGREQAKKHSDHLSKMYQDDPEKFQKWIDSGMSSTSRKWCDTKPELQMAEILDGLGLRYEKQHREPSLPKPHRYHKWDFRVVGARVLIEVDGCHWHGCEKHTSVDRRAELTKSVRKELDRDAEAELFGWTVLRFWEHELRDAPGDVARCVTSAVGRCRAAPAVA